MHDGAARMPYSIRHTDGPIMSHMMCFLCVRSTRARLRQAEYGPFKPNFPCNVPLWLAIDLKRKKRCKIQPPPWLAIGINVNSFSGNANFLHYF